MNCAKKTAPVSVIIPCFRCTQTLERAVASVVAQTVGPAEIILVDDASGDDTRALLLSLRDRYESGWIKLVLLDQNAGAGSARNAGWAAASQVFVAFLDSDDAWHPRKIEIQCGYMQLHPEIALSGHTFRFIKNCDLPQWSITEINPTTVGKWRMILKNQFVTPSVMVRKDISQRYIDHQRYMEDHMLWMCIICDGLKVANLNVELAAIYKGAFGVNGLSSQIWNMAFGDFGNFWRLFRRRSINILQFCLISCFSAAKFARRLMIYYFYLQWIKH